MRRIRSFRSHRPQQNLDSFLDILTNTVGVLMFISLFITLVAVQSSTIVRTPLVTKTEKKGHFFEVRGNQVMYLDDASVDEQISEFVRNLPTCTRPSYSLDAGDSYLQELTSYQNCLSDTSEQLKEFRAQTKYYEVELLDIESVSWQYTPKSDIAGEATQELAKSNSEYRQALAQLNPQQDYLAFLVRPDSFVAFRQAREIAWKAKFDVGWEPKTPDAPIIFGSGGRAVGVQ